MERLKRKTPNAVNIQGEFVNDLKPNYSVKPTQKAPEYSEILRNFRQTIMDTVGQAPAEIKASGQLERFSSSGKPGDLSGWYVLFLNTSGAAGMFGCWRTGIKQTWGSSGGGTMREQEWQHIRAAIAEGQRKTAQARATQADQAHTQAVKMWLSATPANPKHPYLMNKGVGAYGIRQQGQLLLIPVCDLAGTLHGLQTIDPTGRKRFLTGTPKRGHFCLIGNTLHTTSGVYLCEGYATGASLYEAYQQPVMVAFDAGNLLPVATTYRARFAQNPLTVCADNDRKTLGNPGLTQARAVCAAFPGVGLIVPEFPPAAPLHLSDFNDLIALLGSNAHKEKTA